MISALEAGKFYQVLRERVEEELRTLVSQYSPAAWLWYLRRLPLFFFDFEQSPRSAYTTSDLAEVVSGLYSSRDSSKPVSHEPLLFQLNEQVVEDLIRFCGKTQALRRIHQRLRSAGKEVAFRSVPGELPVPAPTPSQREALINLSSEFPRVRESISCT